MTVANSNNRTQLSVSGYDYDFTFKIFDALELKVYGVDSEGAVTLLTYDTDYAVTVSTVIEGGTVQTGSYVETVWTPAEPAYSEILMLRAVPFTQAADIPVRGGFREDVIEAALDHLEMQIQQLSDTFDYNADQDPLAVATAKSYADAAGVSAAAAAEAQVAAGAAVSTVADAVDAAMAVANDVDTGHDHDGVNSKHIGLGDYASKSPNATVYTAATDGFVVYYATGGGPLDAIGYTDGSNPPTTIVARCAWEVGHSDNMSMMFPVKKGNYYKVSAPGGAMWFVPFGN